MGKQGRTSGVDRVSCSDCRTLIRKGEPKVSKGAGWICQACAYDRVKGPQRSELEGSTFEDIFR
jgi:hypothetical protein